MNGILIIIMHSLWLWDDYLIGGIYNFERKKASC